MSRILPILRPLARRFPPLNFWVAQFYDAERSKPPALSPVAVPFDIPQVVKAEVTKNLHMKYRYEWPFGYKAGSSISYAQIKEHMPSTLDFYKSLPSTIGKIVGEPVDCTRDDDLSSASVLVYEKPGDSIWWHYDVNFYGGRHFTILVPITVQDSDTLYQFRDWSSDSVVSLALQEGQLLAFEGDKVFHRATPQTKGLRVVLSMTFASRGAGDLSSVARWTRQMKDIAYFGGDAVGLGAVERAILGGKGGKAASNY